MTGPPTPELRALNVKRRYGREQDAEYNLWKHIAAEIRAAEEERDKNWAWLIPMLDPGKFPAPIHAAAAPIAEIFEKAQADRKAAVEEERKACAEIAYEQDCCGVAVTIEARGER